MNFQEANEIGKTGEKLCKGYFEKENWLVTDCSGHKLFQTLDIDFVIQKDDKVLTIDVKTDTYDTGNVFIETISNDNKNTDGCIYASKADYWFYYLQASDSLLIFSPAKVGRFIDNDNHSYRTCKHPTYIGNKIAYHSHGVLLPISDIPNVKRINNFKKKCA